jgi:uncharacterized protein YkwD
VKKNIALLLLLASSIAWGCGGQRQRTRLGTEQTETEIAAPAPSAPQYATTPPEGSVVTGGLEAEAVQAAMQGAAEARSTELTGDPRLATLAEWIAERLTPAGDPPPPEVIDFFAWNLGLMEPTPHVMVLGLPDRAQVAANVERSASQFLSRQTYTHWGGTVLPRSGVWLIVVVLSWRHVELTPIPRSVPAATPIQVQGRLATGFQNPTIVVQAPSGEVTRLPAGSGPDFDVRVPTNANGAFQIEVLARGPHGESVVANAPVYVGAEPPRSVRLDAPDPASSTTDIATVRGQLLTLLNQTRAETGLGPLEADPRLDAVALAHTEDMVAHDYVGHVSQTTGSAADRVRAAGVHSGLILENIGRGYSASEIHRGLLDSPGHRANLINPSATHVGIGVVAETENGRTAFLVTEVFIQIAQAIDVAAAPAQLLERMNRARVARGAPEMRIDTNVQQAAQHAAEQYFSNPSLDQAATTELATQELRRFSIAFRRLGGVMAVVSSLEEAQQLEPTLQDDVRVCGIGVAQGTRPDSGPNAIAIVIVLAWER